MVVRNDRGEVLPSKLVLYKDVAYSSVAEALACSQAVQLGVNMGLATVVIEGDALTIIKKCQLKELYKSVIGAYIRDIQQNKWSFQEDGDDEKFRKGRGYAHFGTGINNKRNEESRTRSGGQFISDWIRL
ncbi:hypothetical protein Golob_000499, partial [Gossypium lobatum]|nr:hypothetical protein [Gossypium lobatum]